MRKILEIILGAVIGTIILLMVRVITDEINVLPQN